MQSKPKGISLGVALGAALGAALGVAAGHVAIWLAVGVAIGLAIAGGFQRKEVACSECAAAHYGHESKTLRQEAKR